MNRAGVALGSNLGDRPALLRQAVAALRDLGEVVSVSPLYRTGPMGGPPQDDYFNAVVVLDTPLAPEDLLVRLSEVEDSAGRERHERWGPRTLDLDLITVVDGAGEAAESDTATLTLPHPRAHRRRFVLEPLAAVWPQAPLHDGRSAESYLPEVADQPVDQLGDSSWSDPDERPSGT